MKEENNFGDLPLEYCSYENSKIVIIPIPYDGTTTWVKGSNKGPKAIISASANMELYDIETDFEVCKKGIFTDTYIEETTTPEKMIEAAQQRVNTHIIKNKFVVVIGGEHSVSIGAIKAHINKWKDVTVLQLDAHSDLRQEYNNSEYNHACVMSRIKELCPIVQVGIRSMDSEEKKYTKKKITPYNSAEDKKELSFSGTRKNAMHFLCPRNLLCKFLRVPEIRPEQRSCEQTLDDSPEWSDFCDVNKQNIFFAEDIYDNKEWIDKAISKLSKNVYITLDLDVFDPSIMPSTGTPEPGGLLWYDALDFLKKVIKKRNLIGFDIVELCPNEINKAPDFLAAKLIYKILSYKFKEE